MPVKRAALFPLGLAVRRLWHASYSRAVSVGSTRPLAKERRMHWSTGFSNCELALMLCLISLEEAIELGLRNNPDLVAAFRAIQRYEWQLIAVQRQWYPTLELSNGAPFVGLVNTYIQNFYNSGGR